MFVVVCGFLSFFTYFVCIPPFLSLLPLCAMRLHALPSVILPSFFPGFPCAPLSAFGFSLSEPSSFPCVLFLLAFSLLLAAPRLRKNLRRCLSPYSSQNGTFLLIPITAFSGCLFTMSCFRSRVRLFLSSGSRCVPPPLCAGVCLPVSLYTSLPTPLWSPVPLSFSRAEPPPLPSFSFPIFLDFLLFGLHLFPVITPASLFLVWPSS